MWVCPLKVTVLFTVCVCKNTPVRFFLPNPCAVNMHVLVWKFFNFFISIIKDHSLTPCWLPLHLMTSRVSRPVFLKVKTIAQQDTLPFTMRAIYWPPNHCWSGFQFSSEFPYCRLVADHYHEIISSPKLRVTRSKDACGTPLLPTTGWPLPCNYQFSQT